MKLPQYLNSCIQANRTLLPSFGEVKEIVEMFIFFLKVF